MSSLIFIDTNILLDFYRIEGGGADLSLLNKMNDHSDKIITGNQVEMEYKKNRQRIIIESLKQMKSPDWSNLYAPAFLGDSKQVKSITRHKKIIIKHQANLKNRIEKILKNPSRNDIVYKSLQKLFNSKNKYNLSKNHKLNYQILQYAERRFRAGYPPRKKGDNSIGDAINWEWIIYCAKDSMKNIIIVTRDSDYGITNRNEGILNDWLRNEFKDRVSKRKRITLTNKLSTAFKAISVNITKEELEIENKIIEYLSNDDEFKDKISIMFNEELNKLFIAPELIPMKEKKHE